MNLDWQARGLCVHPSMADINWSPVEPGTGARDKTECDWLANTFCARCPVLDDCRRFTDQLIADRKPPQEVVWAGMWWPRHLYLSTAPKPIDLLADLDEPTNEGVAA